MKQQHPLTNDIRLTRICHAYNLRAEIGRKQPKRAAWEVTFHTNNFRGNVALAEVRATQFKGGELIKALNTSFEIVKGQFGCADITATFILG